jgi:hypothetical protein
MSCHQVYQLVDSGQGETVFWTSFIQIHKIHTHLPFAIGFLYHYHIGQPIRVINFSDEPCHQKFLYLVRNDLISVWSKYSSLLLYRAYGRIHVYFIANDRGVDAGISSCVQAKTSMLLFRNSIRAFFVLPSICVPMLVVFSGFSSSSVITSNSSVGSTSFCPSLIAIV